MPNFVPFVFAIFFMIFAGVFISIFVFTSKARKNNNTPIKRFSVYGKTYSLFSVVSYNQYTNSVIYQLKDDKGALLGSFNSLDDVLTFLNIKEFPADERDRYY